MKRKEFVKHSLSASLYLAIGSTLASCLNEDREILDENIEGHNKRIVNKPIYLVSENLNLDVERSESTLLLDKWSVVKELITYGYITSYDVIPTNIVQNSKFKVVRLNDKLSCIIFKRPLKMFLPETYRRLEYSYTIYEELKENFSEKKVVF